MSATTASVRANTELLARPAGGNGSPIPWWGFIIVVAMVLIIGAVWLVMHRSK